MFWVGYFVGAGGFFALLNSEGSPQFFVGGIIGMAVGYYIVKEASE